MKKLINLFAPKKFKELFGKAQCCVKGKKTYLAGTILMLQAVAKLVEQFTGLEGLGGLYEWLQNIATNDAVQQFGVALGLMGIRAGISKTKTP